MLALFKRDHFILGFAENNILYIKNGKEIVFDSLHRLGYDASRTIDRNNNLFVHHQKTKVSLFMPMRTNKWLSPMFTMVSAIPLNEEQVRHFYRFCELMGGTKITISQVSSVKNFLENPSLRWIKKHYYN